MDSSCIENRWKMLPIGSVRAKGFLLEQLEKQRDNFTDLMEKYPDYSEESGWLGGTGEAWERGPYYVRGLVALAYVLHDTELIQKSKKWIVYSLTHQDEEGNFYPGLSEGMKDRREYIKHDWWPHMPMLMAIRDYYEAEKWLGHEDENVLPFFERYFKYQLNNLPKNPLKDWAKARGGDNIELTLWYYDMTHEDWILDLAMLLESQTYDWIHEFTSTHVQQHVVNTVQAYKTPYLQYRLHSEQYYKEALHKGMQTVKENHGRIDDLPNADEAARDNLFTRGTESCAVAEAMLSMEICGMISGESKIYDYLELYAYNSLPNCFTYDMSRVCYFQMQNEILATCGYHDFECDHGDSSAYGAPTGFDCCFANIHMAYPKFVQNMWMADNDSLVLTCYGPCEITAYFNGKEIHFIEQTIYPYEDTVKLSYSGKENSFKLYLRQPEWVVDMTVSVNGMLTRLKKDDGYQILERTFCEGDTVWISMKVDIKTIRWHDNSVAIRRGALLYCLPIAEQEEVLEDVVNFREIKFEPMNFKKTIELYPASKWNYALYPNHMSWVAKTHRIKECSQEIPCSIRLQMLEIPEWNINNNVAAPIGLIRHYYDESRMVEKELVPYSHSRLKISIFSKVYVKQGVGMLYQKIEMQIRRFLTYIQVSFSYLPEADEYLLECQTENEIVTLFVVPMNIYHGGAHSFLKKERFTFEAHSEKMILHMKALQEGKIIGQSESITVQKENKN